MIRVGKVSRLTLGLILIVFGINGFTGFLGTARLLSEQAEAVLASFEQIGFLTPLLAIYAVIVGIALVTEFAAPVAALLSVPLVVGAVLYFVFYDVRGGMFAYIAIVANALIFSDYKGVYKQLLRIPPKKKKD